MATQSLTNPFLDYGGIVFGNRFVGRHDQISFIEQRVLGENYGNIAIMGLPRIGKSSLAWQSIMTKKDELIRRKVIPIFFQVGSYESSTAFFKQIVSLVDDEMMFYYDDTKYTQISERTINELRTTESMPEINSLIQKYFKVLKRLGYRVIIILDEFDSVQRFFNVADFQTLRELSNNPDTKVCLVTCSRKTIQEIEAQNGAISNFYGIFSDIRLGVFDESDMVDYWNRVNSIKSVNEDYKSRVTYYVGRHPFLLDFFNSKAFLRSTSEIENLLNEIRIELLHCFDTMQDTLKHENLLDSAIQLVLGPAYNVSKINEEKLLKYDFLTKININDKNEILGRCLGVIIKDNSETFSYACFSNYLTNVFVQEHVYDIDYWPLWTSTEKSVRRLIKCYISESFSADWETELVAKCGESQHWMEAFNKIKDTRSISLKKFPGASLDLVDYTFPCDMYNIFMKQDWKWFGNIFSGKNTDWGKKFNFLANIRNPVAHNNREFVSKDDIKTAQDYCNEILRSIQDWESKSNSLVWEKLQK